MAHLSRILIYPVKSLDAVTVEAAPILASGALVDDRRFAIVDALGQYVNGKRQPRVHLLRSAYNSLTKTLLLRSTADEHSRSFHIDDERNCLEQWLSTFFGFDVSFQENDRLGFPDDTDSPGPTLISTATLREVAGWFDMSVDEVRQRFRANLEIDGVPPFWEDRLYGPRGTTVRFRIGDVIFDGINPCQRCVVPARDAATGKDSPNFAKRFVEMRRRHFPKWAEPSRFNHFYRLAVNTCLVDAGSGMLRTGDAIGEIGLIGAPVIAATPKTRWSGTLRVTRVVDETPSVRTFRLAATDGKLPFSYLPGQYLTVRPTINGLIHRRTYTLSSSPTCNDYCELTVKKEESGTVSRYLHEHVRPDSLIEASGPDGAFTFTGAEASGIVLIGAGVGLTPLMSKLRYLTDIAWPGKIDLVYSVRTAADFIFQAELADIVGQFSNVRVTTTLTAERSSNPSFLHGRINAALLRRTVPDIATRRVHVCGPIAMATDLRRIAADLGVPAEQFRAEAFGGPRQVTAPAINGQRTAQTVTFAGTAHTASAFSDQTVIDIADSLGVNIDHGCLAGVCGRCKVRLVAGQVSMDVDIGLSDADKADGIALACQARPLSDLVVAIN